MSIALVFDATKIVPATADDKLSELSSASRKLLNGFPSVPDHFKKTLTAPPGVAGQFVCAAMSASHRPFLKFAIPATLATLSGIVGREYKAEDGTGLALNFILAASSGAGKSDAIAAWETFCWKASKSVSGLKCSTRVHLHDTRSIQAIMKDFTECPAAVWANDEAGSLLKTILDPKPGLNEELRDSFNKLFDSSKHHKQFSPPKSIRAKNDGEKPIHNISMSVLLALPISDFELPDKNALNGFLARTLVIRHKGRTVKKVLSPNQCLPDDLGQLLIELIGKAKELDDLYSFEQFDEAERRLTFIDFSSVNELYARFDDEMDDLVLTGMDDDSVYTALNRVTVIARRIAGTLAVIENPHSPAVSLEQLQWSLGYVLQNFAHILSDFDTGEVGDKASDEEEAVKRTIKDMLKSNRLWRNIGGVPKKDLRDRVKHRAPFVSITSGRGPIISRTLDEMLKNGDLSVVDDPQAGSAHRPVTYLGLSE